MKDKIKNIVFIAVGVVALAIICFTAIAILDRNNKTNFTKEVDTILAAAKEESQTSDKTYYDNNFNWLKKYYGVYNYVIELDAAKEIKYYLIYNDNYVAESNQTTDSSNIIVSKIRNNKGLDDLNQKHINKLETLENSIPSPLNIDESGTEVTTDNSTTNNQNNNNTTTTTPSINNNNNTTTNNNYNNNNSTNTNTNNSNNTNTNNNVNNNNNTNTNTNNNNNNNNNNNTTTPTIISNPLTYIIGNKTYSSTETNGQIGAGYSGEMKDGRFVITIRMGQRNTGGYSIDITNVNIIGNDVVITVKTTSPPSGSMTTQAITYPAISISFNREPSSYQVIYENGNEYPKESSGKTNNGIPKK